MAVRWLDIGCLCASFTLLACAPTISLPRGEEHLDALAEAQAHEHHGRREEAIQAYGRAAASAERRVDREEALYRQSRVYASMGDYENAIAVCDELGRAEPMARRTLRARLDAARYRLEIGEGERADAELRALVVDHPESAAAQGALRTLTQLHVKDADSVDNALHWVRQLSAEVDGKKIHESLLSLEADLLIAEDRFAEAKAVLERQVEAFPYPHGSRWDNALWKLADLALKGQDPKGAVQYLERMIGVHEKSFILGSYTRPLFPKAALRIARIYRDELRDEKAALKAYAHVRAEFPKSLVVDDALEEEGMLRIASGDTKKGCALLHELLEKHEVGSARRRAEENVQRLCR